MCESKETADQQLRSFLQKRGVEEGYIQRMEEDKVHLISQKSKSMNVMHHETLVKML